MLWKYLSVLCASIALFCFAQNSLAEYSPQQPREDNLLILGLKIDYLEIQELVPAYRADDEFYLPISILGQILGLSVNVDLGTQSATGFIIDEDRQFQLNVKQREIILSGILQTFPQHQVFVYPDDIYVNSKLLQQWWPMSFELNLFTSQVLIKTREKLPFQQRMKREADIEKMRNRYTPGAKNFPKQDTRYSLISTPFIDQRISANYSKDKAGNVDEGYNYSTHIKTDLLYHEASLFLTGNNEEDLNSTRFNVSRTDPDGGLLSFMNATRYSFWNIFTPSSEYVSTSKADVVGITASNYPLNRQNQYDKHTFEGELLPDWEVELYHNNVLIAYKDKPDNGRYRFEDIPLLFGHNYFKLVFYGPHGESREETHTFSLTGALVRPGEYHYQATVTEDEDDGQQRSMLVQNFGISKYLSGELNFSSIPVTDAVSGEEEDHIYVDFALNGFWRSLFYRLNYVDDTDGGNVSEISLQNRIGRTNLSASLATFNKFESDRFSSADYMLSREKLRIDTLIPPWWLPQMPIAFEVIEDEFESGNVRRIYSNRIAAVSRGLAITNHLTRTVSTSSETVEIGQLQISTHTSLFSLRTEFYYQTKPVSDLTSIGFNFSGKHLRPYQFNIGVSKYLEDAEDEYQYTLGLNKQFGNYAFLASTSYSTTGERSIDLSFSISLGRDPRKNVWHAQAQPLASTGSASILVFFDKNQNGKKDADEEGISNLGFKFNDSLNLKRTDDDGVVLITGLSAHTPVDISISMDTLKDPLMVPAQAGVRIVPRNGHIEQIAFPVILTGEIDGTAYVHRNGKDIPAGEIIIELYDMNNKLVQKTSSAYDGFYVLSKIPAGRYLIKLSSEQAEQLGLLETVPREIVINPDDPFVSNLNFIVFKDPKAKK